MDNSTTPPKPEENPLMRPDHELPVPHDMLIEAEEKDGMPVSGGTSNNTSSPHNKSSFPMWIFPLIALFIVLLAGGMYMLNMQKVEAPKAVPPIQPTATAVPTPNVVFECTPKSNVGATGQQIYKNAAAQVCFYYPGNSQISDSNESMVEFSSLEHNDDPALVSDANYRLRFISYKADNKFPILFASPIGKNIASLSGAQNSSIYKTRQFKVGKYTAIEFIDDQTAPAERESSYSQSILIQTDTGFLIFSIGSLTKAEVQKHNKDFMTMVNSLTFANEVTPMATASTSATPVTSSDDMMVACTMDAKMCPDGSSVGRIAPKCEFAACPGN